MFLSFRSSSAAEKTLQLGGLVCGSRPSRAGSVCRLCSRLTGGYEAGRVGAAAATAAAVVQSQNKLMCVCTADTEKTPQTENVRLFIF